MVLGKLAETRLENLAETHLYSLAKGISDND